MNRAALKVVDTNVVTRIIVQDDPAQLTVIEALLQEALFVPSTVLLESVWVLSSTYRMERTAIADALLRLLDLPAIEVETPDLVVWAIEKFRHGADFGDMLHLIVGRGGEAFLTFDRGVSKATKDGSPIPVVTLRG